MASDRRIFDFVLGRERALAQSGCRRHGKPEFDPAPDSELGADRIVRLDAAGRRLVEDHIRLLVNRHRGRDAA